MQSKAASVAEYLDSLPEDRRDAINTVRAVILDNLDSDYREGMQYGMIGYFVPHEVYPAGYHCDPRQPLPFMALGSQKNHMSLHLMCLYMNGPARERFEQAWIKAGKKLDMGKACVRFKSADDLALDVLGDTIRRVPAKVYIKVMEDALASTGRDKTGKRAAKPASKKAAAAKVAKKAGKKTARKPAKKAAKKAARKATAR